MSTRATYEFNGKGRPRTTVYIHHDGYPEGAAGLYLVPAIEKANGYLSVEAFLRANERAEITQDHQAHGDTEYRYTFDLDAGTVKVDARCYPDGYTNAPRWKCGYVGAIAAFVNDNAGQFRPGVEVRMQGNGRWLTAEMAKAEAEVKRAEATAYRARFPQFTGNADGMDCEAERAERFAAEFSAKAPAQDAIYRYVGGGDGKPLAAEDFASIDALTAAMGGRAPIGTQAQHLGRIKLREQLVGRPTYPHVIGPMWGGIDEASGLPIIRYETQAAYDRLSA